MDDAGLMADRFNGQRRSRVVSGAAAVLGIAGRVACWALVTSLLIARPFVVVALVPLGVLFFLLSVVGGFALEARGLVDHRWALLAIGLGAIALAQIYDGTIRFLDALFRSGGGDHL
jgi:hypothetical protein